MTARRILARRWPRLSPIPRGERGPLRVAFVITSMPVGGAETLLANLIDRFDPEQVRAEVVCLKEPGPLGERIRDRVTVHERMLAGRFDVRVLPRLVRLFRRRRFDAVITVGAGDKMFWGRLAGWLAGVPVVASALHSTGWPDGVGRLNRLLTPLTDGFIAVAKGHARYQRRHERFPARRVFTIRNGVDTRRFRPSEADRREVRAELGLSPETPLVGIVAALRPEKNHAMFLQLACRVRASCSDARFVVVGDGPERESIEREIRSLGLAEHVRMLGTRDDTPRLVAALDVFVLCSHNEASPVSILEAAACGVPVVSTDVGSIRESVRDGETGWLVGRGDVDAMVGRVLGLLEAPERRRAFGEAGRAWVCRTGSLDAMVAGYRRLIERLYDRRCEPARVEPVGLAGALRERIGARSLAGRLVGERVR